MFMSRKKRCNGEASRKAFAPAANINLLMPLLQ
jgi:hypothetical protein